MGARWVKGGLRDGFRISMPLACPVDAYVLCYTGATSENHSSVVRRSESQFTRPSVVPH